VDGRKDVWEERMERRRGQTTDIARE